MAINVSGISIRSTRSLWSDNPIMTSMMQIAQQVQAATGFPVDHMHLVFREEGIALLCGDGGFVAKQGPPNFYIQDRGTVALPVAIIYGELYGGNPS